MKNESKVNARVGFRISAHYVLVISIVKDYLDYIVVEEVLAIIQNNIGKIGIVQRADANEAKHLALGESIFLKFLQEKSRLKNILQLTQHIE